MPEDINKLLLRSIRNENIKEIKNSIKNGADVNYYDDAPIAAAAKTNNIEIVELLIKNGANVNQKSTYNALAQSALFNKNIQMVKVLLSYGADACGYMFSGTILSHACYNSQTDKNGENIYLPIDDISFEIAELLLISGASTERKRGDELSPPIEMPIIANDIRTVKLLLNYNVKLTTSPVLAATNYCASVGHYDMLELLLSNGWKPNPKKSKQKLPASPLNYAIAGGHIEIVQLLVENKIKLDYVPNSRPESTYLQRYNSYHPVTLAIKLSEHNILKYLLKNGASPDGGLNQPMQVEEIPPVVMAAYKNDIEAVKILLGYEFNINAYKEFFYGEFDCSGMTALDIAMKNNNKALVDVILKNNGKTRKTHNN